MRKRGQQQKVWKQHRISLIRGQNIRYRPLYTPIHHFWVVASETKFVSLGEVERMRMYLRRLVGKKGKVWARERTFVSLHKKAKGARMGKGVGAPAGRCALIRAGERVFEVRGLHIDISRLRLELPACVEKFSFQCVIQTHEAAEMNSVH